MKSGGAAFYYGDTMSDNPFAGIDAQSIYDMDDGSMELPPIIPNSVLQLDGDISSFYLAWTDETLSQNTEALKRHIEVKRLMAGCETVNVHTTRGAKAGREDAAMVQEYQANRQKMTPEQTEKKARVQEIRAWLETYGNKHTVPMPQWEIEADDSMSIEQDKMLKAGRVSKIMTKDKDLDMIMGTHIHYDTYDEWTITEHNSYGKIWIDRSGSAAKCKGQGTSFFWAQLLMGDGADNIPGLPKLPTELLNAYKPTKAITAAQATLRNPKATPRARKAAQAALAKRKASNIGAVLAHTMLESCRNDTEAFNVVRKAYTAYYGTGEFPYETFRGDSIRANASIMLLEQAKLLWILRFAGDDVLSWIKEVV